MSKRKIFLDTPILRQAFIMWVRDDDWRQHFKLSSDFDLITSQKNIAEIYGILKTNILDSDLNVYGITSSKSFRDSILEGDDFLNIFWHHQILEAGYAPLPGQIDSSEHGKRFKALIRWRNSYEQACADFDKFLKAEAIGFVHYGSLFAHHDWQWKLIDLARDTLIPSEDLEIVLAALFAEADIFLTEDKKLIRFSFSLGLEPAPVFSEPKDLEKKLKEKEERIITFPRDP
jgi:hypothetical protein